MRLFSKLCVASALAVLLILTPSVAAQEIPTGKLSNAVIYNGVDLWTTQGTESTFVDFSHNPIPEGFFCNHSKLFTDTVYFQGTPLATLPKLAFGSADTVVQRLDDAAFDANGIATTRVQMRALSLVSVKPIRTECGQFNVSVSLSGQEQPMTTMRIVRENREGGYFEAPLLFDAKLTFTPVAGKRAPLELIHPIDFSDPPKIPWTFKSVRENFPLKPFVLVDTDNDLRPDTYLPGPSNFGRPDSMFQRGNLKADFCTILPEECACHLSGGCQHCVPW